MMAGVLQSAASPSVASFASEISWSTLDGHCKVFFIAGCRHRLRKGRVLCSSSNFDFQQSPSSMSYQTNSPPPSHLSPQPSAQQPPYQATPTSDQGWSRPSQTEPPLQYQSSPPWYQAVQNQSPLYQNPYRPVFKEPHQPTGYQQGLSQSSLSSQYASQSTQFQSQPPAQNQSQSQYKNLYQSQPSFYQPVQTPSPSQYQTPSLNATQYQSQPSSNQAMQIGSPSQYQWPSQHESQYQSQPSSSSMPKATYTTEPKQSVQTHSLESSPLFQSTPAQPTTENSTSTKGPPLFSSTTSSSSSSSSSSFLSSSYSSDLYGRAAMSNVRRRPYDPEAKMRMKQYRREAMIRQRQQEQENLEKNYVLDVDALYKKGDPGTMQGVVKDIITVGYYMSLPDGREGFLPCMQFNDCPGGIPLLTRLFKVGDEITVRQEKMYDGGLDKLFAKP